MLQKKKREQAGDLLLQISGDECRGLTPDDAAALLRGTENTKVGIVAERGASAAAGGGGGGAASVGKGEKLDLIVTRRKFKVEGVVSKEASIDGRNVGVSTTLEFCHKLLHTSSFVASHRLFDLVPGARAMLWSRLVKAPHNLT